MQGNDEILTCSGTLPAWKTRTLILSAVFTPIFIRVEAFHNVDVLQQIGPGMCFGLALNACDRALDGGTQSI